MSKHTPAPWIIEADTDADTVSISHETVGIAEVYTVDAFPCVDEDEYQHAKAECKANAQLIAAAPLLLEALDKAVNELLEISHPTRCRYCGAVRTWTGDGTIPHPTWHQSNCVIAVAKSALASARGEV